MSSLTFIVNHRVSTQKSLSFKAGFCRFCRVCVSIWRLIVRVGVQPLTVCIHCTVCQPSTGLHFTQPQGQSHDTSRQPLLWNGLKSDGSNASIFSSSRVSVYVCTCARAEHGAWVVTRKYPPPRAPHKHPHWLCCQQGAAFFYFTALPLAFARREMAEQKLQWSSSSLGRRRVLEISETSNWNT